MFTDSRARHRIAVVSLAVAAGLSACSTEEDRGGSAEAPAEGTVAVGVAASPTTLLPPLATSALDGELGAILYLGLNFAEWREGGMVYPEGHPLALARSWEVDGAKLTYRLDVNRRWSDGTPVAARDVVFTYELLRSLDHLPMSVAAARMDSVVARDDSTVVFYFEQEYPGMLFDSGVGVLPSHVYGGLPEERLMEAARSIRAGSDGLVVSGPFTVTDWSTGERIELTRNPSFSLTSRVARIVFVTIPDPTSRLASFRSGELDLAQVDDFREAVRTSEATGAVVLRVPQRGYDYIAWNPAAHPAFEDRRVREALSRAIDRSAILSALDMTDFAEKAYGPYGSIFGSLAPPAPPGGDFDPQTARRLLSEAGWEDRDEDGVRERGDVRLAFKLEVPAGNNRRLDAAQIIQAQLADVGVDIEVAIQEFNSLFARARARNYEAVLLGWQVGLDPDISFFWADPESPVNVVGYEGAQARSHIEQALASTTADAAAPHWREAARLIASDFPYAFLWYFDFAWLASPRLQGILMDPVGFFRNPQEWSLAPDA